jgi:lipoic acid synthetase
MTNDVAVKPPWLRKPVTDSAVKRGVNTLLRDKKLNTVCREARCPNLSECFGNGTATFLILGTVCSRRCAFCAVEKGTPLPVDRTEPERVAGAAKALKLKHVVITSVTRDDLPDNGAAHFAETVRAIRQALPGASVEVLTPDFLGSREDLETVLGAAPEVFNHNLETVPRLYAVRPGASFARSLSLLSCAKGLAPAVLVKTGFLLGMGETKEESLGLISSVATAGVDILSIGQYLAPSRAHHPVAAYAAPSLFEELRAFGLSQGIPDVFSGPFVRSSYMAGRFVKQPNPHQRRDA